ncbi:hypothetical protein OG539_43180 [Actinacidiphila glaucinigra]|uniref:hypothetical protein n=1 Tax=Streptomycetaceae TaxID=2062 RepID=UPI002DDA8B20|nr:MULTISPECIES: hypothetical protein [Streptomycetaceae]WSD57494.1 hypothetical protein OIE69_00245 [Actinacidiphila glaucinigra]WSD65151.1 hypothetical protein OIE69_42975 [Actinacidiphila glaucinigra]WUB50275.1 hypothetical protein OHN19_43875 [Streptomyces griseorubiginosus]
MTEEEPSPIAQRTVPVATTGIDGTCTTPEEDSSPLVRLTVPAAATCIDGVCTIPDVTDHSEDQPA